MDVISVNAIAALDLRGKVICFPTDTVYGVGCLYNDVAAIQKIYNLKARDFSKPLAILVADPNIASYVLNIPPVARKLMKQYWPGALTLVLFKSGLIPDITTGGKKTVGIRMPNNPVALKILNHFGPLAVTSVNISGDIPLNDPQAIQDKFSQAIDYLVVGKNNAALNLPSTVVDCTGNEIKILRSGSVKI